MEYLQHFIRSGMNLIRSRIAQVDDQRILLIEFFPVDPTAVCFLNGISAKMIDQNLFQFFFFSSAISVPSPERKAQGR